MGEPSSSEEGQHLKGLLALLYKSVRMKYRANSRNSSPTGLNT